MLDFPYEITETEDGKYGHRLSSGRWDGVIGKVKRGVKLLLSFSNLRNGGMCMSVYFSSLTRLTVRHDSFTRKVSKYQSDSHAAYQRLY